MGDVNVMDASNVAGLSDAEQNLQDDALLGLTVRVGASPVELSFTTNLYLFVCSSAWSRKKAVLSSGRPLPRYIIATALSG